MALHLFFLPKQLTHSRFYCIGPAYCRSTSPSSQQECSFLDSPRSFQPLFQYIPWYTSHIERSALLAPTAHLQLTSLSLALSTGSSTFFSRPSSQRHLFFFCHLPLMSMFLQNTKKKTCSTKIVISLFLVSLDIF